MAKRKIDCGGPRARYCRERKAPVSSFDRRSLRTVIRSGGLVVVGCPRGAWDARAERCRAGTRAQAVLYPMSSPKCRAACQRRRAAPAARRRFGAIAASLRP